jgi:thiamine pyrophosphate-dependent acetolactate synthase large subunit-like protein
MNNAELIVKSLRAAGVSHGFGIPSGTVLPLLEAMRLGRPPYVLTAHEGSAAFEADVMGRDTGAPGLSIGTLGSGATNLTTGVGNAYLDRLPLLAITCNLPTSQLGRRIQMARQLEPEDDSAPPDPLSETAPVPSPTTRETMGRRASATPETRLPGAHS